MLALLLLAETIVPRPRPATPATATVRIERAISVRSRDWTRPADVQRREIRRVDEAGRPILLRLIEHP